MNIELAEDLEKISPCIKGLKKVHLRTHQKHLSFDIEEILFCRAEGSYTRIFFENSSDILISKSLKEFQDYFSMDRFLRCHYSFLVSVYRIQSFDSKKRKVSLGSYIIPVSRRKSRTVFTVLSVLGIKEVKNNSQLHNFSTGYKKY